MVDRRNFLGLSALVVLNNRFAFGASGRITAPDVLQEWYGLALELVRHTATFSPPVASRAFAYIGIIAHEVVASQGNGLQSLAGQLPGLNAVPVRPGHGKFDEATLLHGALQTAVQALFTHTGPTGLRALKAVGQKLDAELSAGLTASRVRHSRAYGEAVAKHVLDWSVKDGGAEILNLGFPDSFKPAETPGHWKPTSVIRMQQAPLLPTWGNNRTFAIASGSACALPPPPVYSEDKTSEFYRQAFEVYTTVKNITPEQRLTARFWSDDPMLSPTPPGHWMFIALDILKAKNASIEDSVDVLARLGMAMSDAFVACWKSKFEYDLLRPVTYIKKVIDKTWEPILITPPFPEYPSGHSSQSGAAASVLTQFFGDNFAFEDKTHVREKFPVRLYKSFWDAANEAGISRLYGGIHFRAAVERGLDQGRCVGAAVNALKTRRTA
jgi:membrane-associated phospholipid phosphatase